jgi:NADH-quinone oxidoreductase subunit H
VPFYALEYWSNNKPNIDIPQTLAVFAAISAGLLAVTLVAHWNERSGTVCAAIAEAWRRSFGRARYPAPLLRGVWWIFQAGLWVLGAGLICGALGGIAATLKAQAALSAAAKLLCYGAAGLGGLAVLGMLALLPLLLWWLGLLIMRPLPLLGPWALALKLYLRYWRAHLAVLGAGAAAVGLACLVNQLPPISFGRYVGWITVGSTFLAFAVYMVYVCGWLWRQGFADALKLFVKEDVVPLNADRFLFMLAPFLVYLPSLLSWVVLPFGVALVYGHYVYYQLTDLNVGLLLIVVDFSFFLVAVIISGYASNNKLALVGAMREAAELLTYEVPMLMSLLCVALFAGTLNLTQIVQAQTSTWAILPLFPAFVLFFVTALAETNRPPFDLPEASNELMGGFVVEYSGLRFALFYVAEYANIFLVCAEMTVCFLGGWKGPMFLGPDGLWLTSVFWFLVKTYALIWCFIWVRATMPRIRIDQVMFFSWKFLVPASVLIVAITAVGVTYRHPWFSSNELWQDATHVNVLAPTQVLGEFKEFTTAGALQVMTSAERAFFWSYNGVLLLIGVFMLGLAWKILYSRRKHPMPRREVTWT